MRKHPTFVKRSLRVLGCCLVLLAMACRTTPPGGGSRGQAEANHSLLDGGTSQPPLAAPRILALRGELASAQSDYAAALSGRPEARQAAVAYLREVAAADPRSPLVSARMEQLSVELRQEVTMFAKDQTGGEAAVAVHRARVEITLTKLRFYEQACGVPPFELSNELSVLSGEELGSLRGRVDADLVRLQSEAARYHESELPSQLRARVEEVKQFRNALGNEAAARAKGVATPVKPISASLTIDEARARVPALAEIDGPDAGRHFYKRLSVQLEMRKLHAPGDAALGHLSARIKATMKDDPLKPPPHNPGGGSAPPPEVPPSGPSGGVAQGEASQRQPPRGWEGSGPRGPPPPEPPPIRPRPAPGRPPFSPASGGVALDPSQKASNLGRAAQQEAAAVIARDPVLIAQSRAQVTTQARWFQTALKTDMQPSQLALGSLESEQLLAMRESYQRFLSGLAQERMMQPANPALDIEIAGTRQRMNAIDGILRGRHLPQSGQTIVVSGAEELAAAARVAPRSPELLAYERSLNVTLARETTVELRLQLDLPRVAPDQSLYRAYQASLDARLAAQAELLERSFATAQQVSKDALIHGRGPKGTAAAMDSLSVQREFELEAQSLRSKIHERLRSPTVDRVALRGTLGRLDSIPVRAGPAASGRAGLEGALVRLERSAVAVSSWQVDVPEVRLGIQNGRALDAFESVDIRPRSSVLPRKLPGARVPQNFQSLFPGEAGWTKSWRGLTSDLGRAPGGVIVEATLPSFIERRFDFVRVDQDSGALNLRISGVWKAVRPAIPIDILRTAWAFTLDGRAVAVDLRYLDREEMQWLLLAYGAHQPLVAAQENWNRIHEVLALITSVNLHPALVHTKLGMDFIAADELIFDLLQDQSLRSTEREHRYGFDLRELRDTYVRDYPESLQDLHFKERLFSKSILSVLEVRTIENERSIRVLPRFRFDIFSLAVEGRGIAPRRLEHSSGWFDQHAEALRQRVPALARVAAFANAVAIFRTVVLQKVANNLNELALRSVPLDKTPRLLCRGRVVEKCKGQDFQRALNLSPDSPANN